MIKAYSYGQSMYGGWYVNYIGEDSIPDGKHFRTYRDMQRWAKENGIVLKSVARIDN